MVRIQNRDEFVKACRAYMNTPFKHRGRSRKGMDCAGLVVCALRDLGLTAVDVKVYGREPFRDGLRQAVQANLGPPITKKEDMKPGDVVLIKFVKNPHHIAVIGDHPAGNCLTLIHCYGDVGKVVEHRLDEKWMSDIVEVYRIPSEEDK